MTKIVQTLGLALALMIPLGSAAATHAQADHAHHTARVSMDAARHTALVRVPGTVRHEELEREGGRWIYSFEITTGGPGIEEVNVDADTGVILNVEHEAH